MNPLILIIECIAIAIPFTIMVVVLLNRDPVNMITDYPPEIVEEYYRSQGVEEKRTKLTAKNYIAKVIFMIAALAVMALLSYLAGARSFLDGAIAACIYALWIFAYDTFFIDWVLFARIKRWRLPGTEHMDKEYAQKWFHVKACIPMVPVFLAVAALNGLIVMLVSGIVA